MYHSVCTIACVALGVCNCATIDLGHEALASPSLDTESLFRSVLSPSLDVFTFEQKVYGMVVLSEFFAPRNVMYDRMARSIIHSRSATVSLPTTTTAKCNYCHSPTQPRDLVNHGFGMPTSLEHLRVCRAWYEVVVRQRYLPLTYLTLLRPR